MEPKKDVFDIALNRVQENYFYKFILFILKNIKYSEKDGCFIGSIKLFFGFVFSILMIVFIPNSILLVGLLLGLFFILYIISFIFLLIYYYLYILYFERPLTYIKTKVIIIILKVRQFRLEKKLEKSKKEVVVFKRIKINRFDLKQVKIKPFLDEINKIEIQIENNNRINIVFVKMRHLDIIKMRDVCNLVQNIVEIKYFKSTKINVDTEILNILQNKFNNYDFIPKVEQMSNIVFTMKNFSVIEDFLSDLNKVKIKNYLFEMFVLNFNKSYIYNDIKEIKYFLKNNIELTINYKIYDLILNNLFYFKNLKIKDVENFYGILNDKFITKSIIKEYFKSNNIIKENLLPKLIKLSNLNNSSIEKMLSLYSNDIRNHYVYSLQIKNHSLFIAEIKDNIYNLNINDLNSIFSKDKIGFNEETFKQFEDEIEFINSYVNYDIYKINKINIFSQKELEVPDVFFVNQISLLQRPTIYKKNIDFIESCFTEHLISCFGNMFYITNVLDLETNFMDLSLGVVLFHKKSPNLAINIFIVENYNRDLIDKVTRLNSLGYYVIIFDTNQILNNSNSCIEYLSFVFNYLTIPLFYPEVNEFEFKNLSSSKLEKLKNLKITFKENYNNCNFSIYFNFNKKKYLDKFQEYKKEHYLKLNRNNNYDDSDGIKFFNLIEHNNQIILTGDLIFKNDEMMFYNFNENTYDIVNNEKNYKILKQNIKRKSEIYYCNDNVEDIKSSLKAISKGNKLIRLEYFNYAHTFRTISNIKSIRGNVNYRDILSYNLNDNDYFYAYCYKNKEYRTFKYSRVLSIESIDY